MVAQTQQLCTFAVDRYTFGVEVQKVQEVLRFQQMTRVPLAPWVVRGLINLRGKIVTAIDLRRRLGLPDAAPAGVTPMRSSCAREGRGQPAGRQDRRRARGAPRSVRARRSRWGELGRD